MVSTETILTIVSIAMSFMTLAIVLILLIRNRNENNYDQEKKRANIDLVRDGYEKRIYDFEERLMQSIDRWQDANHLLLTSQKYQETYNDKKTKPLLSNFLKAAGLSAEDLVIDKRQIFFLTPYNEKYSETFEFVRKICNDSGLKCIRGDEEYHKSDFLTHILKQIIKSNIIIANVDGRSPNVYYELGICHAIDKKTIILSQNVNELVADVKSKNAIIYKDKADLEQQLKKELIKIAFND